MKCNALLLAAVGLLTTVACSGPSPNGRTVYYGPDPATFPPVGNTLENHCGSLDCHGSIARNLRVYGVNGLRLPTAGSPGNVSGIEFNNPDAGQANHTTAAEYEATYRSVTMLEPELMYEVLRDHGAHPERLTLVRKARGTEHHKGGAPMPAGSPGDRCLVSWLAGNVDKVACDPCTTLKLCCSSPQMPPNKATICQEQVSNPGEDCWGDLAIYKLNGNCN